MVVRMTAVHAYDPGLSYRGVVSDVPCILYFPEHTAAIICLHQTKVGNNTGELFFWKCWRYTWLYLVCVIVVLRNYELHRLG
jgi:hypothetical protein